MELGRFWEDFGTLSKRQTKLEPEVQMCILNLKFLVWVTLFCCVCYEIPPGSIELGGSRHTCIYIAPTSRGLWRYTILVRVTHRSGAYTTPFWYL